MTTTADARPRTREARATGSTRCEACSDGLGKPRPIKPGSFRERVHRNASVALAWRIGVFVAGLLFMALGVALAVLPGPLTIPPVLVGLWIWSTEFDWARRFFQSFLRKARNAWRHARQHPVSSLAVTVGGLAAAGVAFWAVGHYRLVDQAKVALGL
jgi:uncharacterized membrane protein YbaN (DUF454 family)